MKAKKYDVIIQARMGSTRLKGKTLMDVLGEPILFRMIERVKRIKGIDQVIVATTDQDYDNILAEQCRERGIPCYRGEENDVLKRIYDCAVLNGTDVVVQITGDDCLSCPTIAEDVITMHKQAYDYIDYVANDFVPGYSYGFGVKAYKTEVLSKIMKATSHPTDREHVVNYIEEHPEEFSILSVPLKSKDYKRPDIRLTLDTDKDFFVMSRVFESLYPINPNFTAMDIISFLDAHPEIRDHNNEVVQATYTYNQELELSDFKKGYAVLTGCNGQLGRNFCKTLLDLGYQVIGLDLSDFAHDELNSHKERFHYFKCDVTKKISIESLQWDKFDRINALVNNAGVSCFSPFEERTEEELDFVLGVNVKGPILLTQFLYKRYFKPQSFGRVINLGSIYGQVSGDMRLYKEGDRRTPEIYGGSKAAMINITKYLAAYMAKDNVTVNCLSPGGIFNHQDPDFVNKYENKVPMSRMGETEDLQSTIKFFLENDSSYLTGQNVTVDGGFTAW